MAGDDLEGEAAAHAEPAAAADGEREAKRARVDDGADDGGPRLGKKRKVAVLLGYVGAGYAGLQRNPGVRTIEDELERAFHAAGGISDDNMGDFSKARCFACAIGASAGAAELAAVHRAAAPALMRFAALATQISWSRAARTDKGVSAVGQVVALKVRNKCESVTLAVSLTSHATRVRARCSL